MKMFLLLSNMQSIAQLNQLGHSLAKRRIECYEQVLRIVKLLKMYTESLYGFTVGQNL